MLDQTIKSLLEILNASNQMRRPVYRGQNDAKWKKVESAAVRRIKNAHKDKDGKCIQIDHRKLLRLIQKYQQQELIKPLKLMRYLDQSDESMLAKLQHHESTQKFSGQSNAICYP